MKGISAAQLQASQERMRAVSDEDALKASEELLKWLVDHEHPAAAVSAARVVLAMVDSLAEEYFAAGKPH